MLKEKNSKKGFFRGLSSNVITLGLVSLLNDVSSDMIYPLLPVFLTTGLGASNVFVGLIEGVAETVASVFKLVSGYLSDKLKVRKGLVLFGFSLSGITRPIIAISQYPWHVLVARSLDRVGKGTRTSPRDALLAASCDDDVRGKAFGFHRSLDHLGAVIGPILASIILFLKPGDYRTVFWIALLPALLSVMVLIFFVKEKSPQKSVSTQAKLSFQTRFPRNFRLFIVTVIFFTLGNSSDAFLILRAKSVGVSIVLIPILWVYFHLVKMLASTPFGIISDRFGRKKIIFAGWLIYTLVYLGFGFATSNFHIWILFGIYGLYYGLTEGVEKAFVTDLIPDWQRGTAFGFYNLAVGITALPSSLIMGFIWDRFGVLWAFSFGSFMAFLASFMLIFFVSEKRKRS